MLTMQIYRYNSKEQRKFSQTHKQPIGLVELLHSCLMIQILLQKLAESFGVTMSQKNFLFQKTMAPWYLQ